MLNIKAFFVTIVMMLGIGAAHAQSQVIEIPIDELPSESVTPALDSPVAVQSRILSYNKRWEFDLSGGFLLDEPFYNNQFFGMRLAYHWNETSGAAFRYFAGTKGISDYGKQFNQLDFSSAHGPESGYALAYENRFIYGKVSFSKNAVLPITFLGQFELGQMQYGSKALPFLSAGIGNNLFFTNNFGVNLMVRFMARQAMDPLSQNIRTNATTAPDPGSYATVTRFGTGLDIGGVFLF